MAKRLRLKIFKVIPSFHSCRLDDTSTLPSDPAPCSAKSKLTYLHFPQALPLPPSQSTTTHSSIRRQVSSAFTSVGCGFRSRSTPSQDHPKQTPEFRWEKEKKWHVVAKVREESACPHCKICEASISGGCGFDGKALPTPLSPRPSLSAEKKKKKKKKKKRIRMKKAIPRLRISTSSAESGLFSSEGFGDIDDEETEALVTSSSSSESNPHLQTIREKPSTMRRDKKNKKKSATKKTVYSPECESPARLSVFQRLIPCKVEGKVRESFAVVKRSEDPYKDFKRSMMEMILEKEMWDETDLEQLLHCFLSLNDKQHHGIIIQAFSEIWEALFCRKPSRG